MNRLQLCGCWFMIKQPKNSEDLNQMMFYSLTVLNEPSVLETAVSTDDQVHNKTHGNAGGRLKLSGLKLYTT